MPEHVWVPTVWIVLIGVIVVINLVLIGPGVLSFIRTRRRSDRRDSERD